MMEGVYKLVKQLGGVALHKAGVFQMPEGCLVLTYHRVTDSPDLDDSLKVSKSTFEKQMAFLKRRYAVLTDEEFISFLSSGQPYPPRSCFITFDDGWADNYVNAYPILQKYKLPATVFLATDYVGTDKVFWHTLLEESLLAAPSCLEQKVSAVMKSGDREIALCLAEILRKPASRRRSPIYGLVEYLKTVDGSVRDWVCRELKVLLKHDGTCKSPDMLSWEQVREMFRGNIAFGAHTQSHALLTQLSDLQITEELVQSKAVIEREVGKTVTLFCYPNGNYNERIADLTRKAGYVAAFTCNPGINAPQDHPFELKRIHVLESMSVAPGGNCVDQFFEAEISGVRAALKSSIRKPLLPIGRARG